MTETSVLDLDNIPEETPTPEQVKEQIEQEHKAEADLKISSVLAVPEPVCEELSGNESTISQLSPEKPKRKKYAPKGAKTRKNMIKKLQELYAMRRSAP